MVGDNAIETLISHRIGTDHQYIFTEKDAATMTGYTLSFMVKVNPFVADIEALLTLTTGGGSITITNEKATLTVADTDTNTIPAGTYSWELKRMDGGQETVLGYGKFRLVRGVHHS